MHPLPHPLGLHGCGGFEEDLMLQAASLGLVCISDNWTLSAAVL